MLSVIVCYVELVIIDDEKVVESKHLADELIAVEKPPIAKIEAKAKKGR